MSGKVITITSGKGGVGKTTATANIGAALAALGNKVVCIDADIGLRNLDVVMGLEVVLGACVWTTNSWMTLIWAGFFVAFPTIAVTGQVTNNCTTS